MCICKILYFINFVIFVIVSLKGTVTLLWVIVLQFTSKSHVNSILSLLFLRGSHTLIHQIKLYIIRPQVRLNRSITIKGRHFSDIGIFLRIKKGVVTKYPPPPHELSLSLFLCDTGDLILQLREKIRLPSRSFRFGHILTKMPCTIAASWPTRQGYILTNLINMSVKLFSTVSIVFFPVDFKSARYHSRFCIFN